MIHFIFKEMENFIKIRGDIITANLPVKDNTISLDAIKIYYPDAVSLTYKKNGEMYGTTVENGLIQLHPGVTDYDVFCRKTSKGILLEI